MDCHFSKYIPEGTYHDGKMYVLPSDDIVRTKKFILEKARQELEILENEINKVSNTQQMEQIADAYFNKMESCNVSNESTEDDVDNDEKSSDELSEN
jgi:hypothetical protein